MNRNLRQLFVAVSPAVFLLACGSSGGSSGSGGTGGAGGGTTTTTSNSGGSTTSMTGGGGTGGNTTTSMTGGGGTGGNTTTGMTGGGGTGGETTGTGGAAMGDCLDATDQAVIGKGTIAKDVGNCAQQNFGAEPGTKDCIKKLGLTDPCTTCFDDNIQCVVKNCLGDCAADQNSQACLDCRAKNCDPAFAKCSGLKP